MSTNTATPSQPRTIAISLREVSQLFNTMDPSPFHEKDLDDDAEKFIVGWAKEFSGADPLTLSIHVLEPPTGEHQQAEVERAVQHYFAYATRLQRREFRRMMREGRQSLFIGLAFLASCLVLSEMLTSYSDNHLITLLRESLTIGGWVAMWQPLHIYLYDWWPVQRLINVYKLMSHVKVELHVRKPPHANPRTVDEFMNI